MVRVLAGVAERMARAEVGLPDTVDESFALAPDDTVASVREAFLTACAHSREVARGRDLEEQVRAQRP